MPKRPPRKWRPFDDHIIAASRDIDGRRVYVSRIDVDPPRWKALAFREPAGYGSTPGEAIEAFLASEDAAA